MRLGRFPNTVPDGVVHACAECGLRRLAGDPIDYESEQYRELVDSDSSAAAYYRAHDHVLTERLGAIGIANLRDKLVVDVGAGAGSFLDAIKGIASRTVGVETERHASLIRELSP